MLRLQATLASLALSAPAPTVTNPYLSILINR